MNRKKRFLTPYDHIVNELNIEIDRYGRLIEALRRLPPMLEERTCRCPIMLPHWKTRSSIGDSKT